MFPLDWIEPPLSLSDGAGISEAIALGFGGYRRDVEDRSNPAIQGAPWRSSLAWTQLTELLGPLHLAAVGGAELAILFQLLDHIGDGGLLPHRYVEPLNFGVIEILDFRDAEYNTYAMPA